MAKIGDTTINLAFPEAEKVSSIMYEIAGHFGKIGGLYAKLAELEDERLRAKQWNWQCPGCHETICGPGRCPQCGLHSPRKWQCPNCKALANGSKCPNCGVPLDVVKLPEWDNARAETDQPNGSPLTPEEVNEENEAGRKAERV